jgi:hypothetical protein
VLALPVVLEKPVREPTNELVSPGVVLICSANASKEAFTPGYTQNAITAYVVLCLGIQNITGDSSGKSLVAADAGLIWRKVNKVLRRSLPLRCY